MTVADRITLGGLLLNRGHGAWKRAGVAGGGVGWVGYFRIGNSVRGNERRLRTAVRSAAYFPNRGHGARVTMTVLERVFSSAYFGLEHGASKRMTVVERMRSATYFQFAVMAHGK